MPRAFVFVTLACLAACWAPAAEGRLRCGAAGECPSGWFCRMDGFCWSTAAPDAGAEDAPVSDTPAPSCGSGLVDEELGRSVATLLGAVRAPRSGVRVSVPFATATLADGSAVPPGIAVEALDSDQGLVAAVTGGADGVVVDSLRLDAWDRGRSSVLLASPFPVRSIALRADGPRARGIYVRLGPVTAGQAVAETFEFEPGRPVTTAGLFANEPPNAMRAATAVVGGSRAVDGASAPLYFIAYERVGSETGPGALGAVEPSLSMGSYRATFTPAELAGEDLFVSGTVSDVVLLQSPTTFVLGLWQVGATALFGEGMSRGDDVVILPIRAVGAASLERVDASSSDLRLAVPVDLPEVPSADVLIHSVDCPGTSACSLVASPVPLTTSTGRPPQQVVLTRLPAGFALTVLHPADASPRIEVMWLDDALDRVATTPIELPTGPGEVVAIDAAATRTAAAATLLLGMLIRDAGARQDRTAVVQVRGCFGAD